jgi:hypothetical protein
MADPAPKGPMTAAEVLRIRFLDEIATLDPARWLVIGQRFPAPVLCSV